MQTLNTLREMIIRMDIAPGERLTERWLESILNVSRTPIREALTRLQHEGLVEREGKKWVCSPIDYKEIDELCVYREALESEIIIHIMSKGDAANGLNNMLSNIRSDKPDGYNFHIELAKLSGNRFFIKSICDVLNKLTRLRYFSEREGMDGIDEHERVLVTMCSGNVAQSVLLMKEHISFSSSRLIDVMKDAHFSIKSIRK